MTKKKESKSKKTKRENKKYPYLDRSMNLKSRRDYMDNVYYVNGIKNKKGKQVIRELNDDEKQFLNKFNAEYYGASFEKDDSENLHQYKTDKKQLKAIRDSIRELKAMIKEGEKKGMSRDKLKALYNEVEATREQLTELNPKLKCTDANNHRNSCLLNIGKATNEVKFVPWEDLEQDTIGQLDIELLYILNDIDDEED